MSKKKALGDDPLSWIRDTEKPDKNVNDKEVDANVAVESNEDSEINPEEKDQENQEKQEKQENRVYEPSDVTEKYRKYVMGATDTPTAPKEGPATIFVVVYTVLLIILGFLVYRDMSKKINKLETKIISIEQKIESSYETYEKANLDDVW